MDKENLSPRQLFVLETAYSGTEIPVGYEGEISFLKSEDLIFFSDGFWSTTKKGSELVNTPL